MSALSVVKVGRTRTGYRLRVEGKGTMRESPAVLQFAAKTLEDDAPVLTLDLSACDYLDSTFLGCLIILYKRYGLGKARWLLVSATPEARRRLLTPNHLDAVIKTSADCPEVLGDDLTIPPTAIGPTDLGRHILECHRRLAEVEGPNQVAFGEVADRLARELTEAPPKRDGPGGS